MLIPLAIMAASICSCNSHGEQGGAATTDTPTSVVITPVYDASLPKGAVTDSITCRSDNSQNYALYLPADYTPAKQYPCIFFFDAHARGAMPLSMYKSIAEQYGFVMVGSNASKNGTVWQVTEAGVKTLMQDVRNRINIDQKRIYTSGFSGGARVASSIAALDGGVAGVIGCAAGFSPQGQNSPKFSYVGITGDYDFNIGEMTQLDETLEHNGFQHQLLTAPAIHGWASATDFATGVLWLQVNAMKEHLQPKNDALIAALKKDYDERIAAARSAGNWISAYNLSAGAERTFSGLDDITAYKRQTDEINASASYKSAIALQAQLQTEEMSSQQLLQKEFPSRDEKWWAGKIAVLNKNAKDTKQLQRAQMNRRLLSYLGFVCYMYSDQALKSGNLANANAALNIFKMADPMNPDCNYLRAIYYMEKSDSKQAITSLNEAASGGYNDVVQLITEPAFNGLHDDAGFKNVVAMARKNVVAR